MPHHEYWQDAHVTSRSAKRVAIGFEEASNAHPTRSAHLGEYYAGPSLRT